MPGADMYALQIAFHHSDHGCLDQERYRLWLCLITDLDGVSRMGREKD